jgi:phosphatidylserine/phosphatidylglycerophosphate/cardiolipin synthase-like enzyme
VKTVSVQSKIVENAWRDRAFFVPTYGINRIVSPHDHSDPILATHRGCQESTIRDAFIEIINKARYQVYCCSFLIGGETVTRSLIEASSRLKGHTYLITAMDEKLIGKNLEREGEFDEEMVCREIKRFPVLTNAGVYVRGAPDCHAKFLIVDGDVALIASSNFDQNGLGEDLSYGSGEVGIIIEGLRVHPLMNLFRYIWKSKTTFEAFPHPQNYAVTTRSPDKIDCPLSPDTEDSVIWTADHQTMILDNIVSYIRSAQKRILLATYSFTSMIKNRHLLLDHLLEAANKGIKIELFMRARSRDLKELIPLLKANIKIKANLSNHAKYAIIDDKKAILFSANFDGIYGLTSGVEVGVRLINDEVKSLIDYHERCWSASTHKVILVDSKEQLLDSLKYTFDLTEGQLVIQDADAERVAMIMNGPWITAERDKKRWLSGENDAVLLAGHEISKTARKLPLLAEVIAQNQKDCYVG